ncbi:MAG: TonB-dependent receptor [Flavobacteriales bacterium]|jgi:outer membrane receptor protein involved in Fe transport|nr:TonB-dependent receptor [Flavobacteriales bacterium]MBK6882390.1 TonB-dependent receptor [Flavobacteriales bacterium]MBK7481900.1 TonB-dependent receptor [Flavobacteriales bacterium]MBK8532297.1 TonB-dependent receptor [Flavobacteriales bacterium]MBK8709039.1 TonB-dependent receptor [Flavobacteriales bacterium]
MRELMVRSVVFCSMMVIGTCVVAQQATVITGTVVTAVGEEPIPYATVVALQSGTAIMIEGATTGFDGRFELSSPTAALDLVVSFIGYRSDTLTGLIAANGRIDAGVVHLEENMQQLSEVEVLGEVSRTRFELDKRVFTVGEDLSSTGASALEVLNNVPSVNVSIEGVVSLRGSAGVQILIDGKPSILADGQSNALGTITADMIESVEVITNPSAKYDAAGTAGILNIVLKKEEQKGLNGSVSVNTGWPENHSVGVSLNRRTQKFNLFTQMGIGYRSLPRYEESINEDRLGGSTIQSEGTSYRKERFYNITLGTDYHIDPKNVLTLSGNFAYEIERNPASIEYNAFSGTGPTASQWVRDEDTEATNPKYQYDLQYKREFKDNKEHTLLMSAQGSYFGKDQSSVFTTNTLLGEAVNNDQRTATKFNRADYTMKLDYTDPLTDKVTIETGAQYALNDVGNEYAVQDLIDGAYVLDPDLTNDFRYDQKVLGVYGTAAYEGKRSGIKLGLRMENTDLKTLLATTNEKNDRTFTDLFPSAHATHKISEFFSLQAGYSRRIWRPELWDLNPFFNITNNFNIRTGNPNLQPEYTDSFEFTSILIVKKASLNASVYHLYTTEVVERISLFADNVNTTIPLNIGTNAATGFEFNGKYDPVKWVTLSADLNFNLFDRRGEFEEQNFDFNGEKWTSRLTTKFKLPADFDLELTGNYISGYQTVQSEVSGFAFMDMGIRKKIMKGKGVFNISVRDAFSSRIEENVIDRTEFYLYTFRQRGRFITLGFSYGFGKGDAMTYSGRRH